MILDSRFLISIILLLSNSLKYQQPDKPLFISPLKIPLSLSSNFGELRADHFHSGIDIKTQGVTGKEVLATADGYVYLVLVSPVGFGKAIFIRHSSGYSTVYGHLEKFAPEIEEYVITKQYENKSFPVTIYPPKERFRVLQGELIGYSGNTGGSYGPHLHYEIRKSDGEKPVNPLLFNFGIEDNLKPVIEKLAIYPRSQYTIINNYSRTTYISVLGSEGKYYLSHENELQINGPAAFGIKSYDLLNNTLNRCGISSIELLIDSVSRYKYEINEFSFYETRFINAHIDYEARIKDNIFYEKTFVLPNDKLSLYKSQIDNGVFDFSDNKLHHIIIIVKDASNNKSVLAFAVDPSHQSVQVPVPKPDKNLKMMSFRGSNEFISDDVKVNIPEGALYDTLFFSYRKSKGDGRLFSDIHHIHNAFTPVHKAYHLSIKPDSVPEGKGSKLLIAQIEDDKKLNAAGGIMVDGFINADVLSFGDFAVAIDTLAPVISANGLVSGADLTGKTDIRIKITDDFSGIKSYVGTIDGKWALFEYDAKENLLVYKFDAKRISKGTKHDLALMVSDERNNCSFFNSKFTW